MALAIRRLLLSSLVFLLIFAEISALAVTAGAAGAAQRELAAARAEARLREIRTELARVRAHYQEETAELSALRVRLEALKAAIAEATPRAAGLEEELVRAASEASELAARTREIERSLGLLEAAANRRLSLIYRRAGLGSRAVLVGRGSGGLRSARYLAAIAQAESAVRRQHEVSLGAHIYSRDRAEARSRELRSERHRLVSQLESDRAELAAGIPELDRRRKAAASLLLRLEDLARSERDLTLMTARKVKAAGLEARVEAMGSDPAVTEVEAMGSDPAVTDRNAGEYMGESVDGSVSVAGEAAGGLASVAATVAPSEQGRLAATQTTEVSSGASAISSTSPQHPVVGQARRTASQDGARSQEKPAKRGFFSRLFSPASPEARARRGIGGLRPDRGASADAGAGDPGHGGAAGVRPVREEAAGQAGSAIAGGADAGQPVAAEAGAAALTRPETSRDLRPAAGIYAPALFAASKGRLSAPLRGSLAARFGQRHSSGSIYSGIIVRGARGAEVEAVFPGDVVFSGEVEGLGKTLILKHEGPYHSVYARLGRLDYKVGDHVPNRAVVGALPSSDATLHFEIRANGKAVDPLPWIAGGAGAFE